MSDIENRLINLLKESFEGKDNITSDTSFVEDLRADSLDFVQMLMEIEEEFGVTIPDKDVEGMKKVSDVIKYLEEKQE
ncbi:acyl carrier protein [Lyticum sinuosum]|uniref:Acyl carrier protein n=1 Tax=Lyticum sinuosum TaxID=1332059 RepID=A0AAE4VL37_9RICK|nr:acyl carrier protein [Lyticum sinuosum]MDZ5761438.1 Acyl carrier protein [Lyticum sinuosum]